MARAKGRDLVPQHALSQSVALRQDAFPCADLDYASAIAYLRGRPWLCLPTVRADMSLLPTATILSDLSKSRQPRQQSIP